MKTISDLEGKGFDMPDYAIVKKLISQQNVSDSEMKAILETSEYDEALRSAADKKRIEVYGRDVYIRGLIEFSNYCKNNCYYCGIRRDNRNVKRYRLSERDILSCCEEGYSLVFIPLSFRAVKIPIIQMKFLSVLSVK